MNSSDRVLIRCFRRWRGWAAVADRFWLALAWRLPRRLVTWCAVRVGAYATTGQWSSQVVPDLTFMDAMRRWDD